MLESPEFWLLVSFIILVVLAFKPVGRLIIGSLDERALSIKKELDDVLALKEEAYRALSDYKEKKAHVQNEVGIILSSTGREVERLKKQAKEDIDDYIIRRTNQMNEKIASHEARVMRQLRFDTVDTVVEAVNVLIKENLTDKLSENMIDSSINGLPKKLH